MGLHHQRAAGSRNAIRRAGCALLACLVGLPPASAFAAAWTRNQGEWLLVIPTATTVARKDFDDDGDRVDRPRFRLTEVTPLIEYGFTDRLTGGLQPKYRSITMDTAQGRLSNSGVAETDVYLRQGLWRRGDAAFSVQGLVKVPLEADPDDAPVALGRDQVDAEIALEYGNRHRQQGGTIFYNVAAGFRKRFEEPDDQVIAKGFIGWSGQSWTLVVNSQNTIGLDNDDEDGEVLTAGTSFRSHNAGLIAAYRFTPGLSVAGGVSTTYAGRNVGAGRSGSLSMVLRY